MIDPYIGDHDENELGIHCHTLAPQESPKLSLVCR